MIKQEKKLTYGPKDVIGLLGLFFYLVHPRLEPPSIVPGIGGGGLVVVFHFIYVVYL
jgi:hypothetical protein